MRSLSPEASASSRLLPRCCYSFVCPMPTRRAWRAPHEHLHLPCPTPLPPSESLSSIALFISTAVGSAHCRPLRARMSRVSRCRCRTTFQRVPHPPRRRSTHSDASQSTLLALLPFPTLPRFRPKLKRVLMPTCTGCVSNRSAVSPTAPSQLTCAP